MLWPLYFGDLPHPQNQPGHLPPPEIEAGIPFTKLRYPGMGTYWGEVNGTQGFGVET
jgi:hypothetical protein